MISIESDMSMRSRFDKYRMCWRLLICVCALIFATGVAEIAYIRGSFFKCWRGEDLDLLPLIGLYFIVLLYCAGVVLCMFMLSYLSCPCCHKFLFRKFWNFEMIKKILKKYVIRCPCCHEEIDTK